MADTSLYGRLPGMEAYRQQNIDRTRQRSLQDEQLALEREKLTRGASLPATVQIANEIQNALKSGDIERANLLHQVHKTMDRGVLPYGMGAPFQYQDPAAQDMPMGMPQGLEMSPPQTTAPPSLQQFGRQGVMAGTYAPQAIPGYGEAIGGIAAAKRGMEERAKLEQQMALQPQIRGMEQQVVRDVELAMQPKIDAARQEAVGGIPEREKQAASDQRRQEQLARSEGNVVQDANRALQILEENMARVGPTTAAGGFGAVLQYIPATDAYALNTLLESVKSNISIQELQSMREASPTGGALGQIPVQQQRFLMQLRGTLTPNLPADILSENIKRVVNMSRDIIHGTPEQIGAMLESGLITPERAQELSFRYPLSFDEFGLPPQQGQEQDFNSGQIAINPETGERMIFIDGRWRPL
jgi:hypothetical protein